MADKATLRAMVKSFYDAQKLRMMTGNRLVANVRVRLGQDPGTKADDTMNREGQKLLKEMVEEHKRVTDGLVSKTAKGRIQEIEEQKGVIADIFEFELTGHYLRLLSDEEQLEKIIAKMVKTFPIWDLFLEGVKGCGPLMAAVIISELDPYKARHVSSFWRYAGLDVADDGKGRSRKGEHLQDVEYVDKEGEIKTKKGITFNPFLKTKLVGVLGGSFIKCGSPYRQIYDGYKHRLECHPAYKDVSKGHRHNMANRYMIKMFLKDLWLAWREIEGLPVTPDYAEAKLSLKHGA